MQKGDRVTVINYGSICWCTKDEWKRRFNAKVVDSSKPHNIVWEDDFAFGYDWRPDLVGQDGTIDKIKEVQGKKQYSVDGISGKHAWYFEDQLKLIE